MRPHKSQVNVLQALASQGSAQNPANGSTHGMHFREGFSQSGTLIDQLMLVCMLMLLRGVIVKSPHGGQAQQASTRTMIISQARDPIQGCLLDRVFVQLADLLE